MRVTALLLITILISCVTHGQDYRIFSHTFEHVDSAIRKQYTIVDVKKVMDVKRKLTHIKYKFQKDVNLVGVTLTYMGRELKYVSTIFICTPAFAGLVQNNIQSDKAVTVLLLRETEMIVYNSERRMYTYIFIDNQRGFLVMCHSLVNPILKTQ